MLYMVTSFACVPSPFEGGGGMTFYISLVQVSNLDPQWAEVFNFSEARATN